MTYAVGGKTYQKQKTGKNSPYAYEQQLAEISFNNSIFSIKFSFNSLNRRRSSKQDIFSTIDDVVFEKFGESSDKDKYISPVMDMYFSKTFNAKHELTMNLVGTY